MIDGYGDDAVREALERVYAARRYGARIGFDVWNRAAVAIADLKSP
jgi:hypothetical protein